MGSMVPTPDIAAVETATQNVLQSLFQMMVQASNYDTTSGATGGGNGTGRQPPSREVLAGEMARFSEALAAVHSTASALPLDSSPDGGGPRVPAPLIQYVENGRNPDIYTREFVELVRRMNQLARGKSAAFLSFRDVLARELAAANPELAADVRRVVEATGPRPEDHHADATANAAANAAANAGGGDTEAARAGLQRLSVTAGETSGSAGQERQSAAAGQQPS